MNTKFPYSGMEKVVMIGAHPDDIELGCGATLSKLHNNGVYVRCVVLTQGGRGHDGSFSREEETTKALYSLGADAVFVHDFKDTELFLQYNDVLGQIERHVQEVQPDRVYTMFDQDRHQDHRTTWQASMVACRSVDQILGYETPSAHPNFLPTYWERVTDGDLQRKLLAIQMHKSQRERPYMQQEIIKSAAIFRGYQNKLDGPAEGFVPYKMVV